MRIKIPPTSPKIKLLVATIILLTFAFITSIIIFQKLINEGSSIADIQCLRINPIIIDRKRAYINSLTALKAGDTAAYNQETDRYLALSKKYIDEQTKWLATDKAYIDRWDFQLFVPSHMKELAITQYVSRAADTESTRALIEAFKVKDLSQSLQNEQLKQSIEQAKIRNAADKKYSELQSKSVSFDMRTLFITVPASKCSERSFDIPNVQEFLNPSTPRNFDTPIS